MCLGALNIMRAKRGGRSVWFGRKRRGKEKISFLVRQPPSQKIEKKE